MKNLFFVLMVVGVLMLLLGKQGFQRGGAPEPQPIHESSGDGLTSESAKKAKANAEILHEMVRAVFNREPNEIGGFKNKGEFGNWADTLNQGASFEGVYHGLVQSADYRKLDVLEGKASPEVVRLAAEEISALSPKSPQTSVKAQDLEAYSKMSVFGLKRVLGEEALKVFNEFGNDKKKRAHWYAQWVIRMCSKNIDFGIPLRNKPDENFHTQWALDSSEDQVKWEILNRVHRLMNAQMKKPNDEAQKNHPKS